MQHKITVPSKLLDKQGELKQKGYATYPIQKYNRKDVARKSRLKEWDYYLIYNNDSAVALTVGKSSSILLISATIIDFQTKKETAKSTIRIASKKICKMPVSSENGDIVYRNSDLAVSFLIRDGIRELYFSKKGFLNKTDFEISLKLYAEPKDSMVIATPFKEDKKAFYYNRKIIGMRAMGTAKWKDKTYTYSKDTSSGILDWGRGVWPYKTTWYWSAGQSMISDDLFGFNLGYGFGDTSAATENMLFLNGKASKLEDVVFHIPKNKRNKYEYLKPWTITSSDHRFEMKFHPILDRSTNLSLIVLSTLQHQVFGTFTGIAVLDDGTIVMLKDFLGFAERVENRW